jgi:glycosyltransferase involved in cell wall biosynthesis
LTKSLSIKTMLVSIIVPSYNKVNFIGLTIESVIAQTYKSWELIVVDDNSDDGSKELLQNYSNKDQRITLQINEQNRGGNYCRNKGLEMAKGEFVIFLDADDLLEPFCLQQRIENADVGSESDLWVFPMRIFREQKEDIGANMAWVPKVAEDEQYLEMFLMHRLPWHTMQPLWRRSSLLKLDGFDDSFVRLQDVELHTRALIEKMHVVAFPHLIPDCHFRIDDKRKTFSELKFSEKFVQGAKQYYDKFFPHVTSTQQKLLSSVLMEVMSNLLYSLRQHKLTVAEYQTLSKQLVSCCRFSHHRFILQSFSWINRKSPVHPKGLKAITRFLLKL